VATNSAIGINHVAIEVGDLDTAIEFYRRVFGLPLRGRAPGIAFLDLGDQFLALAEGAPARGREHHFGLVVGDPQEVRAALGREGVEILPERRGGLEFRDPWGNLVQVVRCSEIQFTKAPHVLDGMGVPDPGKSDAALAELEDRGMSPG